jgi:hypothetical protein
MRAVLAVGLLIALGASADAATVHRARHHVVVQRSAVPTLAAVHEGLNSFRAAIRTFSMLTCDSKTSWSSLAVIRRAGAQLYLGRKHCNESSNPSGRWLPSSWLAPLRAVAGMPALCPFGPKISLGLRDVVLTSLPAVHGSGPSGELTICGSKVAIGFSQFLSLSTGNNSFARLDMRSWHRPALCANERNEP